MSTFEIHGYFETLHEIATNKTLGTRRVEPGDRKMGTEGEIEVTLTEDVTLSRGIKEKTFRASPAKPRRCISTIRKNMQSNFFNCRIIDIAEWSKTGEVAVSRLLSQTTRGVFA